MVWHEDSLDSLGASYTLIRKQVACYEWHVDKGSFVKIASLTCICDWFMICHQIKKITTIEFKLNEKDTMSETLDNLAVVISLKITNTPMQNTQNTLVQNCLYAQYTNLTSSLLESKGIFHNGTPIHFLCSISLYKARGKIM